VAQTNGPACGKQFDWQITAEQAAALEQKLAAHPEDETTRGTLVTYYIFHNMMDRRIPLVLWLIDHHPESDLAGMAGLLFPAVDGPNAYQDARNRWLTQVNLHPNDARVLVNAANAGAGDSQQETIDLLKRARKLDPTRATEPLARLYSAILVSLNEPGLAAQVRNELQSSNDTALVGSVARHVVEGAATKAVGHASTSDFYAPRILATELVTHAQTLEPQNREWADLMEGVKVLPAGSLAPVDGKAPALIQTNAVQTIRIVGKVQAANLQESPSPIYPPLAKAAGIQGIVKLQIRIGADGHVKDVAVISGHPLLITAATVAANLYVYKPTLLKGQAAEVLTDVEIVFRQPEP
jgi:hypothetical protein